MIKIASNSAHVPPHDAITWMSTPGAVADGGQVRIQQVGREIFDLMLEVASGRRTCAERLGHKEFVPWRMGPMV